jgi:hypothetical protein
MATVKRVSRIGEIRDMGLSSAFERAGSVIGKIELLPHKFDRVRVHDPAIGIPYFDSHGFSAEYLHAYGSIEFGILSKRVITVGWKRWKILNQASDHRSPSIEQMAPGGASDGEAEHQRYEERQKDAENRKPSEATNLDPILSQSFYRSSRPR